MKVVFFGNRNKKEEIEPQLPGQELIFVSAPLSAQNVGQAAEAEVVSVFVDSKVDAATIDAMPKLKLITTSSTGFDHIDVAHAKSKGIAVANVPAYGSQTVAEFAFALLLGLSRKVNMGRNQLMHNLVEMDSLQGFDLDGKTLGVIGTGKIGANVAKYGQAFGMKVIAYDIFQNKELLKTGLVYVSLEDLLRQADVISVHLPLTDQTKHLINQRNIGLIKPGSILVNTARGEIVETEALLNALHNGILAGAGLDVFEDEHNLLANPNHPLRQQLLGLPQVIATPHMAFNTVEAARRITEQNCKNIAAFGQGQPENLV